MLLTTQVQPPIGDGRRTQDPLANAVFGHQLELWRSLEYVGRAVLVGGVDVAVHEDKGGAAIAAEALRPDVRARCCDVTRGDTQIVDVEEMVAMQDHPRNVTEAAFAFPGKLGL